jgi:serine/threonine-protein kinase
LKIDLLTLRQTDLPIRPLLEQAGRVFRDRFPNDSGNEIFGIDCGGSRLFVKYSDKPDSIAGFHRVQHLYAAVRHPSLPPLRNSFLTPSGSALVFDWLDAEHIASDDIRPRFIALPLSEKLAAFETVLDLHLALEASGYVAEDLYDGCFLYDFSLRRLYVCDLDEYHLGPYVLDRERALGSTRFMAPEEWVRGSHIDGRTSVFALGRTAAVLLGDRAGSAEAFAGSPAMWDVISKATQPAPQMRYPSVSEFARAWHEVVR